MPTCLRMTNADGRLRTQSQRMTMHGAKLAAESGRAYLSKEDPPLVGRHSVSNPNLARFTKRIRHTVSYSCTNAGLGAGNPDLQNA